MSPVPSKTTGRSSERGASRHTSARWIPLSVLLLSLLSTYGIWSFSVERSKRELQSYFDFRVRDAGARIVHRIRTYEGVLLGLRGLFDASDSVERGEFHKYVSALQFAEVFPGIQGVGYSALIRPEERASHEASVRAEGFPDYAIRPPGEREIYSSIVYIEPFEGRNLRAFGYDMFSEPVRRRAMERARDEGALAISHKVTLVQETSVDVQAGFLIYMPVYSSHTIPPTLEERREQLVGWAYAPFRTHDLMEGVLGEQAADLHLLLYDGDTSDPEALLYSSPGKLEGSQAAALSTVHKLNLGGAVWRLVATGREGIEANRGQQYAAAIWMGGVLASLLLTMLTRWLTQARARADAHARDLQELNADLESRVARAVGEVRDRDRLLVLQSRQAAMGEMIGNIAHQWRQPLSALGLVMANLADAHEHGELDTPTMERLLADGHRLIRKMSSTIDDFRGFFRPDKEQRAFSAREQVLCAVDLVRPAFVARHIQFQFKGDKDVLVWGLPNELSQVILNLLANAKDAIAATGASQGTIEIELEEAGDLAVLRVRDTGCGIPEEAIERIFEPYFSTKPNGTGIGLYMSKTIIEKNMGGRIEARNTGAGAEITIKLKVRSAT